MSFASLFRERVDKTQMDAVRLSDLLGKQQSQSEPKKIISPKYVVALDFDGTCVTHEFPKMGKDCPHAVEVLKKIVAHGAGLVLFTMRSGDYLDDAVRWFAEREIPLYGIQMNPTQHIWTDSNKCYAHLYIDDAALGCPLIYDSQFAKRPFVDWVAVDRLLMKHDWYMEPIEK